MRIQILFALTTVEFCRCIVEDDRKVLESFINVNGEASECLASEIIQEESQSASAPAPSARPATDRMVRLGADLGEVQEVTAEHGEKGAEIFEKIEEARQYMQEIVFRNEEYESVRHQCRNNHELCAFWATLGECDNNPLFMQTQCAPICKSCRMIDTSYRCSKLFPSTQNALYPGDLNKLFERISVEPGYQKYEPKVLSRPNYLPGDGPENANYSVGMWLVQFDGMLSEHQAKRMIELGQDAGFNRSEEVLEDRLDGTFTTGPIDGRTSTTAWCLSSCMKDPAFQHVSQIVHNLTGIPEKNFEHFQIVRYERGQFYHVHNDYKQFMIKKPYGARILTMFFYLSDVEEGGGTSFPELNVTVSPKMGRALLWPSVMNDHPNEKEPLANHTALPVSKGFKYGFNTWIHMRDFQTPHFMGC